MMRHGSHIDPPNRFESIQHTADVEHLEWDKEHAVESIGREIEYSFDDSKSLVAENNSPDVPFRFSVNPYRGCAHGCSYCYARPTHEYLGWNAGLDFETRILVKKRAPQLLDEFLRRKNWVPETIAFSGVTDCYQPAERQFRLTRQCLEVADAFSQPAGVITKNALVVRDIDVLQRMASRNLVRVMLSITTLDVELARSMEPRTSIPAARLRAIRELTAAGIPVGLMIAPIMPGLNDVEMPAIMQAASEAGAITAGYVFLRLPLTVQPVFEEWMRRNYPNKADMVLERIKQSRGGLLNDAQFGSRMSGDGVIVNQVNQMFHLFRRKFKLDGKFALANTALFRVPTDKPRQLELF